MMPRPRSRRKPLEVADLGEIVQQIHDIQLGGGRVTAITAGPREWNAVRMQDVEGKHVQYWPGGECAVEGVSVIILRTLGRATVRETQADVEAAVFEAQN